jgi:hypothetical protein
MGAFFELSKNFLPDSRDKLSRSSVEIYLAPSCEALSSKALRR